MRKIMISAAAAVTALAVAAPAAAQWGGQPAYGYGNPYGNGYNNNYGHVRSLQIRLNNIERQINRLDQRNVLSEREADRLRRQANQLERRIRYSAQNGLNHYEYRDIQNRIVQLEYRVQREAHDRNRWGNPYGRDGYSDRDRDGRNDRYEDDRGWDHD